MRVCRGPRWGHGGGQSEVEVFCASVRRACRRNVDIAFTKIGGRHTEPPTNWAAVTVARTPDRPTFCREAADFEAAAAYWMQAWGYAGAVVTSRGPDGGADVVAMGAVAQVKAWMAPVGRPSIQQLRGVAHGDREALFFSLSGYTAEARRWAEEAQVALFRFSGLDGSVEALNSRAVAIVEARSISP
jgi:Restriction endonuclease